MIEQTPSALKQRGCLAQALLSVCHQARCLILPYEGTHTRQDRGLKKGQHGVCLIENMGKRVLLLHLIRV